jgi:adenosylhomocysteine nucleosidase
VPPPLTAVVTALREELRPLLRRVDGLRWVRTGRERHALGRLRRTPVVMTATGVGPRRAEAAVRTLLDAFPAARLVGAGLAGGISPGLSAGDLILARDVWADGVSVARPGAWWGEAALPQGAARAGTLVTLDHLLSTSEGKSALFDRLGPGAPAAVDMESAGWVRAAAARGVPHAIVRAILDRAEDDLPGFLSRCLTPDGAISRRRVAVHALTHPRDLRALVLLRRRVRNCAERLATLVEALVDNEP